MESELNVWVWIVGVVSWRQVWLVGVGGIYGCGKQEGSVSSGCGCKEVYRFSHITYPYSSCICSFFAAVSLLLFILLNVFRSCSSTFFKFIQKKFSHNINKHKGEYGRPMEAI